MRRVPSERFTKASLVVWAAVLVVAMAACSDRSESHAREANERPARQAAVQRLTSLLAHNPKDDSLLRELGSQYWALGEFDDAERTFKRSLAQTAHDDTQLKLISLLSWRGRYVESNDIATRLDASAKNSVPEWVRDWRRKFNQARSKTNGKAVALARVNGQS